MAPRDSFTTSIGTSSGDVNGTFVPTKKGDVELVYNYSNPITFEATREFDLPIYADKSLEMSGMYLVLDVPAELEMRDLSSNARGINYYVDGQRVRISWIDENLKGMNPGLDDPLITMKLLSRNVLPEGETIRLTLDESSHSIDGKGELIPNISLIMPAMTFLPSHADPMISQSVYPNPFDQFAEILNMSLKMPEQSTLQYLIPTDK